MRAGVDIGRTTDEDGPAVIWELRAHPLGVAAVQLTIVGCRQIDEGDVSNLSSRARDALES
jgi:hypothetical protein